MAEDLEEDVDVEEEFDDGAAPAGKKRNIKKILIILVPLLVVILGGAGVYFSGVLDMLKGGSKNAPAADSAAPPAAPQLVFYDLPEILVNLNSDSRRQNFLKIRVSLELSNPLDVPKVEAVMPRIIDTFQVYLRELRLEDLRGSAGILRLREELLDRVNNAVKPVKVNDVLFKEMLVQ
jgi:flagellar FliL protein